MIIKKLCKALMLLVAIFTVMSIGINSVKAEICYDKETNQPTFCPE